MLATDDNLPLRVRRSKRYAHGMEHLVRAVQELSLARDLPEIQRVVRTTARVMTGCDGATFVLRDGDQCYYADEDAIEPLWKGSRFPMSACISGWSMLNRETAVIPDIYVDARIPHAAYRPTFVKSLAMVPIRKSAPIGAIGNYWGREHRADPNDVYLLQALADSTSVALEKIQVYEELERRVQERTVELRNANAEIRKLSLTDDLTGLHNRRGFYLLTEQALSEAQRWSGPCTMLFIDLDGLKQVNDRHGHRAGDEMIARTARVLRSTLRESDILARIGGDEFCVVTVESAANGDALRARLRSALEASNADAGVFPYRLSASIGFATAHAHPYPTVEELVALADASMYADKQLRRTAPANV